MQQDTDLGPHEKPGDLLAWGSQAVLDVAAERRRQIETEGWTTEHDDKHTAGDMARAAGLYASNAGTAMHFGTTDSSICDTAPYGWPWAPEWWKPTNARRDLVKAAALILAEIERMDRMPPYDDSLSGGDGDGFSAWGGEPRRDES